MNTKPHNCIDHPTSPAILTTGKSPHSTALKCGECGRLIRWVGKSEIRDRIAKLQLLLGGEA